MTPISPVLTEEFVPIEHIYAKDQPEYNPLPVIKRKDGVLLSRWKLTDGERAAVAGGADILLFNWTFNQPLQPLAIHVIESGSDMAQFAQFMELIDADV